MAISMLKIRRPLGRLIFNMGIAIPGKTVFLIETAPRVTSLTEGNENIVLVSVKQPWREFVIQPYEYNTNDTIAKENM